MTTAPISDIEAQIFAGFDRLDAVAKRLIFEVIHGMSQGRLSCAEVEAADHRMRHGADKLNELENLVDLSNHRIYDAAMNQ